MELSRLDNASASIKPKRCKKEQEVIPPVKCSDSLNGESPGFVTRRLSDHTRLRAPYMPEAGSDGSRVINLGEQCKSDAGRHYIILSSFRFYNKSEAAYYFILLFILHSSNTC